MEIRWDDVGFGYPDEVHRFAQYRVYRVGDWIDDGTSDPIPVGSPFIVASRRIPEPSTLLLCLVALGLVGRWRKWNRQKLVPII